MDLFGDLPEPALVTLDNTPESDVCSGTSLNKRKVDCIETEEIINCQKKLVTDFISLKGYAAERKGEREEMQDAHVIIDEFSSFMKFPFSPRWDQLAYYAVFDGHGGKRASKYAEEHLHQIIAEKFPKGDANTEKDIKWCLMESFKKVDEDFLLEAKQQKPAWKDGTTAVTVLAIDNTLYIANLGDSKATLCRFNPTTKKYAAVALTSDHCPTLYGERMRIQKAGGYVRDGRVMGVLEVSRSIGDGAFKMHGVSCIPDVKKCVITTNDRFIILACDGLWKRFDSDSAIDFVNRILQEDCETTSSDVCWEMACSRLANEAVLRLSADNVTVLLIRLLHRNS